MLIWTSLKSVYAMSNRHAEKIPTKKMAESNGFPLNIRQNYPLFQQYYQESVLSIYDVSQSMT